MRKECDGKPELERALSCFSLSTSSEQFGYNSLCLKVPSQDGLLSGLEDESSEAGGQSAAAKNPSVKVDALVQDALSKQSDVSVPSCLVVVLDRAAKRADGEKYEVDTDVKFDKSLEFSFGGKKHLYRLSALVAHDRDAGTDPTHFYTVAREEGGRWFKFADGATSIYPSKDLKQHCNFTTASMLFYTEMVRNDGGRPGNKKKASSSVSNVVIRAFPDNHSQVPCYTLCLLGFVTDPSGTTIIGATHTFLFLMFTSQDSKDNYCICLRIGHIVFAWGSAILYLPEDRPYCICLRIGHIVFAWGSAILYLPEDRPYCICLRIGHIVFAWGSAILYLPEDRPCRETLSSKQQRSVLWTLWKALQSGRALFRWEDNNFVMFTSRYQYCVSEALSDNC